MNHISSILKNNYQKSVCSFIPFITAGYPNIDLTLDALVELDKQGADAIELGVPYSDALADGPLIQEASKVSIQNGTNLSSVFTILKKVNGVINTPIIIFTYYNPILVRGIKLFITEIAILGAKGLIIPDLPLEESVYVNYLCKMSNIELILFISPTSSDERILDIVNKSSGCLYLVSSTGVTGIRDTIDKSINRISNDILIDSGKMVILGFGIAYPDHIKQIMKSNISINGFVVGSAFTRILSTYIYSDNKNVINDIGRFCAQMKSATLK